MKTAIKIVSILLIVILITNLILLGLGKINDLIFWFVILLSAISSYVVTKITKNKKN